jgi:hypothetical protein
MEGVVETNVGEEPQQLEEIQDTRYSKYNPSREYN